jgi:hypothetical protein
VTSDRRDQAADDCAEERLSAAPSVVDELEESEIGGQLLLREAPVRAGHRQVDAGEDKEAPSLIGATASCGSLDARDLSPDREGLRADGSVLAGGEVIAVEMEEG